MQPFYKDSEKVKGIEVLHFDNVELEKVKGGDTSFATMGGLSVLYFKDYSRFVLQLNDWLYPLLGRLPVCAIGKHDLDNRTYFFPALNGFVFRLSIFKKGGNFAFQNLDNILFHNTTFAWENEEGEAFRKARDSPDVDRLVRHVNKDTGAKSAIAETIKQGVQNMKLKIEKMKTGTKGLTSRKKKLDLKEIKTKDFKKEASSKLKKGFFKSGQKSSIKFMQLRAGNLNNIVSRSYSDLKNTSESDVPLLYLWKEEVEEAILNNKDVAVQGTSNFYLAVTLSKQKKESTPMSDVMESIKGTIREMRESLDSLTTQETSVSQSIVGEGPMEAHGKGRRVENVRDSRSRTDTTQPEGQISLGDLPETEALSHYQG